MPEKQDVSPAGLPALSGHEPAIRSFVENHLMDDCGLIYSHLNAKTLRPWTAEELRDYDTLPIYNKERGDPAGHLAYEDTLMATGEYALSQVIRFEVTGEAVALTAAAHPTYGILRVLYEGEKYEPGYLPKPHGGLRRAAYSHEISPDQYIKSVVALRAYQRYAPPSLQRAIDRYLVAIADYFYNRNFVHPYRERTLVSPETRPHCVSIYVPSLWLAYKITGKEKYREALGRFEKNFNDLARGEIQINFNICSLYMEGFHLALREGLEDERLREAIHNAWKLNVPLVTEDGYGWLGPEMRIKTSRVMRLASLAPIVDEYFPNLAARRIAVFILEHLTDPLKMTYFAEYDSRFVPPGHRFLVESICETSVTSWLLAYWRLRRSGCPT